jgi:hypothetical protein
MRQSVRSEPRNACLKPARQCPPSALWLQTVAADSAPAVRTGAGRLRWSRRLRMPSAVLAPGLSARSRRGFSFSRARAEPARRSPQVSRNHRATASPQPANPIQIKLLAVLCFPGSTPGVIPGIPRGDTRESAARRAAHGAHRPAPRIAYSIRLHRTAQHAPTPVSHCAPATVERVSRERLPAAAPSHHPQPPPPNPQTRRLADAIRGRTGNGAAAPE